MNVGLKKVVDSKGNTVNDKRGMTEFDACLYASSNLKDGDSVFIKWKIEFSSFTDDNKTNRNFVNQVPTQISLCS